LKQRNSRNAKDWVVYWRRKYIEMYPRRKFLVNWMKDGATMRRMMGHMSDKKLHKLIDFCFSNNPETSYLKRQGFPIALLPSMVNKFLPIMENPGANLPEWELKADIPVWDDTRTSFIWRCIKDSDMDSLLKIQEPDGFHILMGKLEVQNGFVPEKVTWFYERWRMREPIERKPVT